MNANIIVVVIAMLLMVLDEARLSLTQPLCFCTYFWFPGNDRAEVGIREQVEGKTKEARQEGSLQK